MRRIDYRNYEHPDESYVSIPRAAKLLGISANGLAALIDDGVIPCIRPRSHRRVKIRDVKQFRANVTERGQLELAQVDDDPLDD